MSIRAKLKVTSLEKFSWGTIVRMKAVYDDTIPEDQRFAKATPSATLKMQVDNPEALKKFLLDKSAYVEFTFDDE